MNIRFDKIDFYVSSDWLDPLCIFVRHVFKFKQLIFLVPQISHAWTLGKKLDVVFYPCTSAPASGVLRCLQVGSSWCQGASWPPWKGRVNILWSSRFVNFGLPSDKGILMYFVWRIHGLFQGFRGLVQYYTPKCRRFSVWDDQNPIS